MTRQRKFLIGALAVLLLGLAAIYLGGRLERYERTVKHGPSPEARADAYLAAVRFLQQQDIAARRLEELEDLDDLPTSEHSLLLLGNRQWMSARQAERLLDWAARGGHLLFVAEALWDEPRQASGDLLLDRLQLQQHETEQAHVPPRPTHKSSSEGLSTLEVPGETAPAFVRFDPAYHLHDPAERATLRADSEQATHLLQFAHGLGRVTVLTDSELWTNRRIAAFDHAWLLWYLARDTQVTLIGRSDHPSLLALLKRHFPEALTALTLLLALALWHAARREGPLLPATPVGTRRLQTHVRGLADFHLRHGGHAGLIAQLQEEIGQRARRRHPGFAQLDIPSQRHLLTQLSLLPRDVVDQALQPPAPRPSTVEFTRQVAHLQTLRNAL